MYKLLLTLFIAFSSLAWADEDPPTAKPLAAVQLYTQDELILLIRKNIHLDRVVADDCQLVEDIRARAEIMKVPAYQFLYGDMLAWGICYEENAELGMYYIKQAAGQGLPEAMEQLGRYYAKGILVQQDLPLAILYLREGASMGNLKSQIQLAELFVAGQGSPYDYVHAYRWLHSSVIADKATHQYAQKLLAQLAEQIPPAQLEQAIAPDRK